LGQWRYQDLMRGGRARNYRKLLVSYIMTQNNTMNRVRVAATELENKYIWRGNRTRTVVGLCAALK